jgi:hypothetical protein
MAEKSKGKQQEELLSMVLDPLTVGVRVEEDSSLEWGPRALGTQGGGTGCARR